LAENDYLLSTYRGTADSARFEKDYLLAVGSRTEQ